MSSPKSFSRFLGLFTVTLIGLSLLTTPALAAPAETIRVSVSSSGQQGNDGSYRPSISADGRYVAFVSEARDLVSGDTNGHTDIFVHGPDIIPPTILSITPADPNLTGAASVRFTVTFSEAVTGVDVADFSLTTTGEISGAGVGGVNGGPAVYTVTVNTGSGNGTLRLDLKASDTDIRDLAGNSISGGFTAEEVYEVCNTAPITINSVGSASPYPSTIILTDLPEIVTDVNVQLIGLTHTWPDDIDILLVGPQGQNLILMSDAGNDDDINNISLTFDDSATQNLPDSSSITSGTYRPTNYEGEDSFPGPAPSPSGATALDTFNGTNPNGTWRLYIVDDAEGDAGLLDGWCLAVSTIPSEWPVVRSITRADPDPTAKASVDFTVTFSEDVTDVDTGDFRLTTTTGDIRGASVSSVDGSGSIYTVTVNTGAGHGVLRLDVPSSATIYDLDGNPLSNLPYSSGQAYAVIKEITFPSLGAQDGWVLESTETSGVGGARNATETIFYIGDDAQDRQYRAILSFDTSLLPDNAVITKVTLKIKLQGTVGTSPFTTHGNLLVDVRKGAFSNNAALQLADFQAAANKLGVGVISKTPVVGWYQKVWTSGIFLYINKAGLTQFRLRFAKDDNDDLEADYLKFYSGNAGDAYRPQLVVEFYVP